METNRFELILFFTRISTLRGSIDEIPVLFTKLFVRPSTTTSKEGAINLIGIFFNVQDSEYNFGSVFFLVHGLKKNNTTK